MEKKLHQAKLDHIKMNLASKYVSTPIPETLWDHNDPNRKPLGPRKVRKTQKEKEEEEMEAFKSFYEETQGKDALESLIASGVDLKEVREAQEKMIKIRMDEELSIKMEERRE